MAFPNVYEAVPELIETDTIVLVKGRADLRGRELQLRALEVGEPDLGIERRSEPDSVLVVELPAAACTSAVIGKLKQLLAGHGGRTPVQVRFITSHGVTPLQVGTFRVEPGAGLLSELRLLLGHEAARLLPLGTEPASVIRVPEASTASA